MRKSTEEILTKDEVGDMIDGVDRLDKQALFSFLYLTGCRVSEALNIRTTNFGVEGGKYMFINIRVLKRKDNFVHTLKISLKSPFMRHLVEYLNTVPQGEKLWKVSRLTVWRWIKRVNDRAFPHLFRHTRLTRLAEMNATETQLMVWAGWKDTKQTGTYVKRTARLIESLADKVE